MTKSRKILLLMVVLLVATFYAFGLQDWLSLEAFQSSRNQLIEFSRANPVVSSAVFFVVYIAVTALSLPFAAILTLVGGAVFGFWWALLLVSFASTIGATLAFLLARTILREWVQRRFAAWLEPINRGIEKDGIFYLFTLRLIPVFPFFLVNMVMGLTSIPAFSYYWVSQLGMLFGTALYVEVGAELGLATSIPGIFSIGVIRAVVALSLFPWLARAVVNRVRSHKMLRKFNRPRSYDANVIVIGGGSAGLVSAWIASHAKAKVVLIEKQRMGGDCLNTGCVPSKTLLRAASVAHLVSRAGEFGIRAGNPQVHFSAVMARVKQAIATIEPHDSVERFEALGVECIAGEARLLSPWSVQVADQVITARSIVLATGARPHIPHINGLDTVPYFTSDTIWNLTTLPKRLLVLGGGPIGCELAQAFARLGSKVAIVNQSETLLPREDRAVSLFLQTSLEKEGIRLLNGCSISGFDLAMEGHVALLTGADEGVTQQESFDVLLVATGRQANTEGLGLEALGIELASNKLAVNEYMQTAFPHIYACGDLVGPWQFTHMAAFQAWYAAINAMFGTLWRFRINYRVVPRVTFTDPEVARVGLNEKEAQEKLIAFELTEYSLQDLDRAITDSDNHGFIRVLTVPGSDRILGVSMVGTHAGELLNEFVFAMTHGLGLKKILGTIHVYPTWGEANKHVAGLWQRNHAPEWLYRWLERWQKFMRRG